jgi:outer membrane protein TolC
MKRCIVRHRGGLLLGLALLWSWYLFVLEARGQSDAAPQLDLGSLVHEARENNPEIQAARQRWEAAKAIIPQVQTLPDPMVTVGYENGLEREWMYGVSQEFPFPGKLRLRGEVENALACWVQIKDAVDLSHINHPSDKG